MKIIHVSSATDQGPRHYQEDRFYAGNNLFAVADGVGGSPNGDKAAQTLVDTIAALQEVNVASVEEAICAAERKCSHEGDGRCTTAVVAYVEDNTLYVHWCGDSRAYIWHESHGLKQLTYDHGYGHLLLACVGYNAKEQDLVTQQLLPGTVVMLTTDGIHDYINVSQALRNAQEQLLPYAEALVSTAKEVTQDNCTAVCFEVK